MINDGMFHIRQWVLIKNIGPLHGTKKLVRELNLLNERDSSEKSAAFCEEHFEHACTPDSNINTEREEEPGAMAAKEFHQGYFVQCAKIDALLRKVHELQAEDPYIKVVVFSQFTSFLDLIEFRLNAEKIVNFRIDGSMSIKARDVALAKFNSCTTTEIFLVSLKAGGTVLNLTSATAVFLMDPWWNPAIAQQAVCPQSPFVLRSCWIHGIVVMFVVMCIGDLLCSIGLFVFSILHNVFFFFLDLI